MGQRADILSSWYHKDNTGNQLPAAEAPDEAESEPSLWTTVLDFFGLRGEEPETIPEKPETTVPETETIPEKAESESPESETIPAEDPAVPEASLSDAGITLYAAGGDGNGNTNNTNGSQNQSGILFLEAGEVSELEQELIDLIKTTGKQKNYELVEYVNDVNREYTEVLMELNINGIMDTAYSYGTERLTNERFTEWTGYNAESYNPNLDGQYLRARYYCPTTADFFTEDSYLGDITDPLTLNRYSYVKSSPLNFINPSGHLPYAAAQQDKEDVDYSVPYGSAQQGSVNVDNQYLSQSQYTLGYWIEEAERLTDDAIVYCDNFEAGVQTTVYLKETELNNFYIIIISKITPDGMTFSAGGLTFEGAYVANGETVIVGVLNASGNNGAGDKGNSEAGPLKGKEADQAAKDLGYSKTNYKSHGQPVYKKGNKYITPDVDSHNGGVWKMADSVKNLGSKATRMGTYDANLIRIGD